MRTLVPATIRTVVILGVVDIELRMKCPCVDFTQGPGPYGRFRSLCPSNHFLTIFLQGSNLAMLQFMMYAIFPIAV